jgi:hypothetical protein
LEVSEAGTQIRDRGDNVVNLSLGGALSKLSSACG